MRYRTLSETGDYVFGNGPSEFLSDSPECVAQAVQTRLRLVEAEWFLDLSAGTPYPSQVLGFGKQELYDQALRERIINTPNVTSIDSYSSELDTNRRLTVSCLLSTAFGTTEFKTALQT